MFVCARMCEQMNIKTVGRRISVAWRGYITPVADCDRSKQCYFCKNIGSGTPKGALSLIHI